MTTKNKKRRSITELENKEEFQSVYFLMKTGEILVYFGPLLMEKEINDIKQIVLGPVIRGELSQEMPFFDYEEETLH